MNRPRKYSTIKCQNKIVTSYGSLRKWNLAEICERHQIKNIGQICQEQPVPEQYSSESYLDGVWVNIYVPVKINPANINIDLSILQDSGLSVKTLCEIGHVKFDVKYCHCTTLVEKLMMIQLMPTSLQKPQYAVHFTLLQNIQDKKPIELLVVRQWVSFLNTGEKRRNTKSPLIVTQSVINRILRIYRRLLSYVEEGAASSWMLLKMSKVGVCRSAKTAIRFSKETSVHPRTVLKGNSRPSPYYIG
ncbi:hypothetical protein EDC94DRAFT_668917 [Helicostylum pulchrum]|nr:hypothetical protein EDC94DRAFT_668917 [Helicostylum pulchrum]